MRLYYNAHIRFGVAAEFPVGQACRSKECFGTFDSESEVAEPTVAEPTAAGPRTDVLTPSPNELKRNELEIARILQRSNSSQSQCTCSRDLVQPHLQVVAAWHQK